MIERFPRVALWADGRPDFLINQVGKDLRPALLLQSSDGTCVSNIGGRRTRVTRYSASEYTALAISSDADRLKSKKIMDQEVHLVLASAKTIDAATERAEQRTRRLIHNLKSLTAKTSQELFSVFRQDKMLASPREAVSYVEDELAHNSRDAARAIVEVLKHQSAQKAEFAAFEKLSGKVDSLKFETHNVHQVLMNVLYLFFNDFIDKKVKAVVEPTRQQATFDYDSVHACVYYIVENAAKYTSPNSALNVTVTPDKAGMVDIRFDMESLVIPPHEEESIFDEGVSGHAAIERSLQGAGIGLFLAREMAALNRGSLSLLIGKSTRAGYGRNTFVITLHERLPL